MLCSGGKAIPLSVDHKPGTREDEKRRIEQLGGRIVYYGTWYVVTINAYAVRCCVCVGDGLKCDALAFGGMCQARGGSAGGDSSDW